MNKTDAFFHRLAITKPFASGEGATLTTIKAESGSDNSVNYNDGFPSVYSTPKSNGGKYVTRGEMNAIGNLASQNQFYFMAGGINTFDQDFCDKIGGYPEGAILDYLDKGKLFKVMSLVDGNTIDFTVSGVDNVNWIALNQDNPALDAAEPYTDISMGGVTLAGGFVDASTFAVGSFISPRTGILYSAPGFGVATNGATWTKQVIPSAYQNKYCPSGANLFIKEVTDSEIENGIESPVWNKDDGSWDLKGFSKLNTFQGYSGNVKLAYFNDDTVPAFDTNGDATFFKAIRGTRYIVLINLGAWGVVGYNELGPVINYTSTAISGDIVLRIS